MKKAVLFFLALVLLISLTGCFKKEKQEQLPANIPEQEEPTGDKVQVPKDSEDFSGSINDLIARNKPVKCEYEYAESGAQYKGTVYIADKKSYTAFNMEMPDNQKFDSYSINDGEWMYSWSNMQNIGTKMKISTLESMGQDAETSTEDVQEVQSMDYDQNLNFSCELWIPDASLFIPPDNITFQDMTEMLESTKELLDNMNIEENFKLQDMCGKCELLSGEQKQDCLKIYGC